MSKHEKAGKPMQITKGPLKDKYFVVIDYLTNQYQGKDIKNIHKAHPELTRQCMLRNKLKEPKDSFVFGRLYPSMEHFVVDDSEIQLEVESKSETKRLSIVKGGKDDSGTTDTGDNSDAEPGESGESERCGVPDDSDTTEVESPFSDPAKEAGPSRSREAGPSTKHKGPSKQKPKASGGAKSGKAKKKR